MKATVPPTSQNRFYADGYDCELPHAERTFLLNPKRPRILGHAKPTAKPRGKGWLLLLLLGAAVIGGWQLNTLWHQQDAERAKTSKAISQTLTPQPTPLPHLSAPRALLAKLPPSLFVYLSGEPANSESQRCPMGWKVVATYKGRLPSIGMLPANGNALGDTWAVGDNFWTFITAPGSAAAEWIDP